MVLSIEDFLEEVSLKQFFSPRAALSPHLTPKPGTAQLIAKSRARKGGDVCPAVGTGLIQLLISAQVRGAGQAILATLPCVDSPPGQRGYVSPFSRQGEDTALLT